MGRCRRVRIANRDISSGDDALVLKSALDRPCEDVVVCAGHG
jgi:polygalacturonase